MREEDLRHFVFGSLSLGVSITMRELGFRCVGS